MSSPVPFVLPRLDMVRETGDRRWLARCPAHDDKSPSLSIRECDDGRVLLHCFGGCDVEDICAAIHIELRDLFEPRVLSRAARHEYAMQSRRSDLLDVLDHESLILIAGCSDLKNYGQTDAARLRQALVRIDATLDMLGV